MNVKGDAIARDVSTQVESMIPSLPLWVLHLSLAKGCFWFLGDLFPKIPAFDRRLCRLHSLSSRSERDDQQH